MKWLNAFLIEFVEVLSSLEQENVKTSIENIKNRSKIRRTFIYDIYFK